jgi:hypothetical protein
MAQKRKDDLQIAAILDQHIRFTTGSLDSTLSKERTRVLQYYDGVQPLPSHKGNSKYVSQDVFESVEALKATILEVFCTNKQIVAFSPTGADDVEMARTATEYCSYIVFRQNPGLDIMSDVLDDGLLARVGVVQFSWEDEEEEYDDEIGPAPMDVLAAHPVIAHPKTTVNSVEDHKDGSYTANVTRKRKKGYVCLDVVPPEDFGITSRAKDVKSAKLCYRRKTYTGGEMITQGWDRSKIAECPKDNIEITLDQEKTARFEQLDTERTTTDDTVDLDDSSGTYLVYHCYAKIDIDGTGVSKLWYIAKCGNIILEKKRVSVKPFAAFVPLRKSHSFYGNGFASKVVPIQNARTVLRRGILDHTVITNSPRWQVVKGGLMNPKELMENRVGGLVNVTRPDAVAALQQAPLNPFVFQTDQAMDVSKEDVTGISRLSKGLNRDAVSTQNSSKLVEDLVSLSDRRAKLIARRFANFLEELYIGVYQLVLDHQDFVDEVAVGGNWVPVDPKQWRERSRCQAEIKVGYGEMEQEAEELVMMDKLLLQRGQPGIYGPEQQYHVLSQALIKKGYKDVNSYLIPPKQQQPPQPDPVAMAKAKHDTDMAQAALLTAQATLKRVEFEREKWNHEYALKAHKEVGSHAIKSDAQTLKERQEAHKEMVDAAEIAQQEREIDIAEQEAAVKAQAISKPNG